MTAHTLDAIVIGGGAAGVSAALMLGRARRSVLVLDAGEPRNRFASHVHGVLGHDGRPPAELLRLGREEVARYGVEVVSARAVAARALDDRVEVDLADGSTVAGRVAILTTGIVDELPSIEGLAERWGQTVLHCPYCHGWEVRGARLGVIATGPQSVHQAELVRQWSETVTLFSSAAGEALDHSAHARLLARGVRIVESPVLALEGAAGGLDAARTADGEVHPLDAVFTAGLPRLDEALVDGLGLALDDALGSVAVDATGATSAPRVWAAGNVVAPYGTIPAAMATGSMAGGAANGALVVEDAERALADPAAFWEARYAGVDRAWSGEPNAAVVDVLADLDPGTALELGCGEGADAIWLARRGWRVTGLDLSPTAVARASDAARAVGVAESARFLVADLASEWPVEKPVDLVVASFLHSPVALDRVAVITRALEVVAPGGHLFLLSHVAPPTWASAEDRAAFDLPDLETELAALDLDPDDWVRIIAEERPRLAHAPGGERGHTVDGVLLLRRAG